MAPTGVASWHRLVGEHQSRLGHSCGLRGQGLVQRAPRTPIAGAGSTAGSTAGPGNYSGTWSCSCDDGGWPCAVDGGVSHRAEAPSWHRNHLLALGRDGVVRHWATAGSGFGPADVVSDERVVLGRDGRVGEGVRHLLVDYALADGNTVACVANGQTGSDGLAGPAGADGHVVTDGHNVADDRGVVVDDHVVLLDGRNGCGHGPPGWGTLWTAAALWTRSLRFP